MSIPTKLVGMLWVLAAITLVFLILAFVLSLKVWRVSRFYDLILVFHIVAILLSLVFELAYFVYYAVCSAIEDCTDRDGNISALITLTFLSTVMLSVAFMFDLYRWSSFLIST